MIEKIQQDQAYPGQCPKKVPDIDVALSSDVQSRENEVRIRGAAAVVDRVPIGLAPGRQFTGLDIHLSGGYATRAQLADLLVVGFQKHFVVTRHAIPVSANGTKLGVVFPRYERDNCWCFSHD